MTDRIDRNDFNVNMDSLQKMLEDTSPPPRRDPGHEVAPYMPPGAKSVGVKIADNSIGIIDEAVNHVMDKLQQLKDKIQSAEQMVLNSQAVVRETIRAHMRIVEAAASINQQIDQQLADALKPLVELTNGK